ncbi:uncharacterized protein EHS24_003838 [Apiotrichum porosum]|uniref:Uncharacterized protein n=1 Tax=Apiotrichum porosum TaxID=105984 RepID=A0A427XDQ2_9TREE|nr:uncharacterized protein EHS24_003838 [Apiotrichum porosum]RSH76903.1 hypothetical protein EHS24_003838 [Apiotrichum porosum]
MIHKRQSKNLVEFSETQLKPAYQRWLSDGTPITFATKLPKKHVNGCAVYRSMLTVLEMAKRLSQLEFDVQGVRCKMYISTVYVYLPSWKQELVAWGVPVPPDSGIHFVDFIGKNPRSDSIVDRWDDKSYQDGLLPSALPSLLGFIFTRTHAFMMCRMLQAVMSAINAGTPFASLSDLVKLTPIPKDLPPPLDSVTGDAVYRLFLDIDVGDIANLSLHAKGLAPDYVQTLSADEMEAFSSAL